MLASNNKSLKKIKNKFRYNLKWQHANETTNELRINWDET